METHFDYVVDAIDLNGANDIPVARTEEFEALSDAIEKFREEMEASPANKLLKDIWAFDSIQDDC